MRLSFFGCASERICDTSMVIEYRVGTFRCVAGIRYVHVYFCFSTFTIVVRTYTVALLGKLIPLEFFKQHDQILLVSFLPVSSSS